MEINESQCEQYIQDREPFILFLYTPLCGTCKLAKQMVEATVPMFPNIKFYSANINYFPKYTKENRISTVPAIILNDSEGPPETVLAIESVTNLYGKIKKFYRL